MTITKTKVKLKHQDGSILEVNIADITDVDLDEEIETIQNSSHVHIEGDIIKKVES